MLFLFAAISYSLTVQINGRAPISGAGIAQITKSAGFVNAEITIIHVLEGEIDLSNIIQEYPKLTKLTMERTSSVKGGEIPSKAFFKSKIQEVVLYGVNKIGDEAFSRCESLTHFSAPSVQKIGLKAFQDCVSLLEFTFPSGVSELPKTAIHGCTSLKILRIEGVVYQIPEYFFNGLPQLRFVYIPSSAINFESPFASLVNVTLIRPLDYCPSLQDFVVPRFATQIGDNLLSGCSSIQHVFVHDRIETIGRSAFANMKNLINVTFAEPSSLRHINAYAFSNSSLEYITFPKSVKSNGPQIFANSLKLKAIYVHSCYDSEWFSEGILDNTLARIVEINDPLPEPPKLHGFPQFTPCPLRPEQKPLTAEEKELYKPKPANANKKENIVFFFSDQQRWDTIGPNGQKLDITPNLDQLAREGVNFKNCFTNQPVCGPVRAVIQTGLYATQTGCFKNAIPIPENQEHTLAAELKKSGYNTAYIGKWHLASDEADQHYETTSVPLKYRGDWDQYWVAADVIEFTSHGYGGYLWDQDGNKREFSGYRTDCVTDYALEYIRNYDDEKPFMLFLSHIEPHHQNDHAAFEGPEGSKEKFRDYEQPPDLTKGKGDWEKWMPDYLGCCNALDKNLGRVISALKEEGIYDNTMIIYTSDHGCHFKSHPEDVEPGGGDDYKRSSYEAALHIPFVVKGRDFNGGEPTDRIISSIDFPSTIIRAAGGEIPESWRGYPIQDYKSGEWKDVLYSQISESFVGRLVRTNRWKYVISAKGQKPYQEPGSDKLIWSDKHLFDLQNDPTEKHELMNLPEYNEIKQELRKLLIERAYYAGEGNFTIVDLQQNISNDL